MKNFVYTAKDVSGAFKQGGITAEDRAAALAVLKAKGLTPTSLTEGKAKSQRDDKEGWKKKSVLAVVAILGVMILGWIIWGRYVKPQVEDMKGKKSVAKTAQLKSPPDSITTNQLQDPMPSQDNASHERPAEPAQPKQTQSSRTPDRPTRILTPGATRTITDTNLPSRRAFTTGTEQLISWVANTRLGDPVPPLPRLPQGEDIGKILSSDITVYDDDDEKTVQIKTNVAHVKQAMKEYVDAGGDPQDFLQFYRDELQSAYNERREGQAELMRRLREEGAEKAQAFADERNRELEDKGIRPLMIPPMLRRQ